MSDTWIAAMPSLLLAFFLGTALGGIYFSTLWLTLRRLPRVRHPALLLLGSMLVRMTLLLLAAFLVVDGGYWDRLLAMLAGFVLLRTLLTKFLGPDSRVNDEPMQTGSPP